VCRDNLSRRCRKLAESMSSNSRGRFEWVDGGLLRAIERGEWVVLDNANFCNPTVRVLHAA
jgi:midasin